MKISIAELYDICCHLVGDVTGYTYHIQSYDDYCIEDDKGQEIILTFEDPHEKNITVTDYNEVSIGEYTFLVYQSKEVDVKKMVGL